MIMPSSDEGQLSFSIVVSVPDQRLDLLDAGQPVASWPISTSKSGLGTEPGSQRTPTGGFVIAEKIGDDAPPWSVFVSRKPTGEIAVPGGEQDGILSRILWLEGTDADNTNTRDRYIYIHGTNREDLIGTPASHGCIRMRNEDIVDLFDRVLPGTPLRIVA